MEKEGTKYVRRTQKDYSMSFKLSVVQEYETSQISKEALKRKYGYKAIPLLGDGLINMVTLTSRTNPTSQWKRVRIKSCLNCDKR